MSRTDAHLTSGLHRGGLFLRSSGFSLVELLVSLCILGILASLAAPSLGTMLQNYQLQSTARQLVTDLQYAKMYAVSQKVECEVAFDGPNKLYSIKKGTLSLGTPPGAFTVIGLSRKLSDPNNPYYSRGVTFTENFGNDSVVFSPIGQASATGTTTFTASGYSTKVTVTLAGGIYVQ
jgi:prepilin-type N-terminal cleavage/methylation domain-containing protein